MVWVYLGVMIKIIYLLNIYSKWFTPKCSPNESKNQDRYKFWNVGKQTWSWTKAGANWAQPMGGRPYVLGGRLWQVAPRGPLRRAWSLCRMFSNIFAGSLIFVSFVVGCLPHTRFLLPSFTTRWRQKRQHIYITEKLYFIFIKTWITSIEKELNWTKL